MISRLLRRVGCSHTVALVSALPLRLGAVVSLAAGCNGSPSSNVEQLRDVDFLGTEPSNAEETPDAGRIDASVTPALASPVALSIVVDVSSNLGTGDDRERRWEVILGALRRFAQDTSLRGSVLGITRYPAPANTEAPCDPDRYLQSDTDWLELPTTLSDQLTSWADEALPSPPVPVFAATVGAVRGVLAARDGGESRPTGVVLISSGVGRDCDRVTLPTDGVPVYVIVIGSFAADADEAPWWVASNGGLDELEPTLSLDADLATLGSGLGAALYSFRDRLAAHDDAHD